MLKDEGIIYIHIKLWTTLILSGSCAFIFPHQFLVPNLFTPNIILANRAQSNEIDAKWLGKEIILKHVLMCVSFT